MCSAFYADSVSISRTPMPRIVKADWIHESWKEKTLLDEERMSARLAEVIKLLLIYTRVCCSALRRTCWLFKRCVALTAEPSRQLRAHQRIFLSGDACIRRSGLTDAASVTTLTSQRGRKALWGIRLEGGKLTLTSCAAHRGVMTSRLLYSVKCSVLSSRSVWQACT